MKEIRNWFQTRNLAYKNKPRRRDRMHWPKDSFLNIYDHAVLSHEADTNKRHEIRSTSNPPTLQRCPRAKIPEDWRECIEHMRAKPIDEVYLERLGQIVVTTLSPDSEKSSKIAPAPQPWIRIQAKAITRMIRLARLIYCLQYACTRAALYNAYHTLYDIPPWD